MQPEHRSFENADLAAEAARMGGDSRRGGEESWRAMGGVCPKARRSGPGSHLACGSALHGTNLAGVGRGRWRRTTQQWQRRSGDSESNWPRAVRCKSRSKTF